MGMFNRAEYKKSSIVALKNNWTIPCVLSLIFFVLASLSNSYNFLLSVCICGILEVAIIFVLMKIIHFDPNFEKEKISFATFLEGIERNWLNALLGSLWKYLWVFLWSLLFFIPGVVKWYSYSMMYFIMAENPKISPMKAMDISKILTNGHKSDLFTLDLSFLGWFFLSCLACGIGLIWLYPYANMARAYAYYDLKKMAIAQGKLTPSDFEA